MNAPLAAISLVLANRAQSSMRCGRELPLP